MGLNRNRAEWAANALDEFQRVCDTEVEDALADLLCDLMHYANQTHFNFDDELARAKRHFDEEMNDEYC